MQNYNSTTELQNVSFHIGGGFWKHVRILNNHVGVDQHGERWFVRGGKLYSEFSYHIISLKNCMK